jgi:5-methylcytosine-specific restriction enzyme B
MKLHEKIREEILAARERELASGNLRSEAQLHQYYETFRLYFGPERLAKLDGEALLTTMHDHSTKDSLVYWLEYKDDDEFPAIFGSIAGGSALKFGIYRRKETGLWMAGSPQSQRELSLEEAIAIARKHRDQLIAGAQVLEQFPSSGTDSDYQRLQQQMDQLAPDVSRVSWGHKYFNLLYPTKLDDFHAENHQRFHLIKLLQIPPKGDGRYLVAGRYVAIANELQMPLHHLAALLWRRNGSPYRYWRVIVNYPIYDGWENNWEVMCNGGFVAIGWRNLGDLSPIGHDRDSQTKVLELMRKHYNDNGGWGNEIFSFAARMSKGDIVVAFEQSKFLGIGRVTSDYQYDQAFGGIPHRRQVDWLWQGEESLPIPEALGRAVKELKSNDNLVYFERLLLDVNATVENAITSGSHHRTIKFDGIIGRMQSILNRKKQVILYGPPGTGKTYWAHLAARNLAASAAFAQRFDQLSEEEQHIIMQGTINCGALVRSCTFHPAYGYEDFLEGYRPTKQESHLSFENRDGIFKALCGDAEAHPNKDFFLVIDEINRGDIPRIFGELLTILEHDKRGQPVLLPLSGAPFAVPTNVYVIGTMNTADRSIALLDTALRRRFGFIELMPDSSLLADTVIEGSIPLGPWLDALNRNILDNIGRDARNLQIGHSYLLNNGRPLTDFAQFSSVIQDDILPLLEEYCYEDYAALARILGKRLIDEEWQRVRHELFEPAQRDNLIDALLAPYPELATAGPVVAAMPESVEPSQDDQDEETQTISGSGEQVPAA